MTKLKNNISIMTLLLLLISFNSIASQKIEIVAGSYYFNPDHILVKIGSPVEISLVKEAGFAPHNIVVSDPDNNVIFEQEVTEEKPIAIFTPKKIGDYKMYCDNQLFFFKSHRERGMKGIIQVVK